jgi:DNA-binding MarR family transcriptional regulator
MNGLKLFGSRRRTQVLELIALLEESHGSEIARLLGAPLRSVQKIVDALEDEGVLVSRMIGSTRRLSFNRRFHAHDELVRLLQIMAERDPEVVRAAESLRRRPRHRLKAI